MPLRTKRSIAGSLLIALAMLSTGCSTTGAPQPATSSPSMTREEVSTPTMLVIDASESMNTSDAPGPRIAAAKSAVASLTDSLSPQAEMGIVAFGSTVPSERGSVAGCRDVTTISELAPIGQSDPRSAVDAINAQGWSPVGAALLAAAQPLGTTEGSIIVVSDGESNCRPDPCATAERIREQHPNITISAIGFKTDSEQLRCIASKGAGIFVTADNTAQLAARLPAIQVREEANSALSSDGLYGIAVGETLGTIRNTHADFPAGSDDGSA